ncbi:SGNH/GDSL hydrolase family protein [Compostibacter hankyongensis]|uniref:SGNH/GDSL hydrolase family protein n=2 Tax=Compostibacter hankyongensis TaxID=1007089 RepID=A0ABP8FEK2_9BACT
MTVWAQAQQSWPFQKEINEFKAADRAGMPHKGAILFTGSSSIKKWSDLKTRFADYDVIQRGFGGSQLSDLLHYTDDIVLPYRPSKIFVYEGDNDIAGGKTAAKVYADFVTFFNRVHTALPETKIYYISIKPSPSRKKLWKTFREANEMIKAFAAKHPCNAVFIDVYHPMLDGNGEALPVFLPDNLHMVSAGYDIWEKEIRKYL